jgi:hypothetical protein
MTPHFNGPITVFQPRAASYHRKIGLRKRAESAISHRRWAEVHQYRNQQENPVLLSVFCMELPRLSVERHQNC